MRNDKGVYVALDFVGFWESGETFLNPCVKLTLSTKKWKTVSCDVKLPFVCLQIPPVPGINSFYSLELHGSHAVVTLQTQTSSAYTGWPKK